MIENYISPLWLFFHASSVVQTEIPAKKGANKDQKKEIRPFRRKQ